jgi:hypothetical protein
MANRITELFEELAESAGGQQQFQLDQQLRQMEAERELYDTDEARDALKIMGALGLSTLPIPGARALLGTKLASRVPGAEKLYGQVGQDFRKYIEPVKSKLSGIFGRSGSGVGADVAGRVPLPKIKDPVVTKQGPRGPINIDVPKQRSLPLEDPRYTKGLSETDREMIKRLLIPPLGKGSKAVSGAKGLYPPPHLTEKAGSKILTRIPRPSTHTGREYLGEPWYINSKTGELYKFHYGTGVLDRGFYNITGRKTATYGAPGRERSYVPNYVRDYLGKNTPTTPSGGGITATRAADKIRAEITKQERWRKAHQNKVRRGEAEYQEGIRSGYEPDIKGGQKMVRESRKRIREIDAKLKELYKELE